MLNRLMTKLALGAAAVTALAGATATGAEAATSCTFANKVVEVHMGEHDDNARLFTAGGAIIVSGRGQPVACTGGTPVINTVDTVLVVDDSDNPATPAANDGDTTLTIENPFSFQPGATNETTGVSEIEFLVDPKAGIDHLAAGDGVIEDITVGNAGLSWNSDDDADVLGMPFDHVTLIGTRLPDRLRAQGGRGTGNPLSTASVFRVSAHEGGDNIDGSDIPGGDYIFGGPDNDVIAGFAGDDEIAGTPGNDRMRGGAGTDEVDFSGSAAGVSVDLGQTDAQDTGDGRDTLTEVENVVGTGAPDRLTGTSAANVLDGGQGGDDVLDGRGGPDELRGGAGDDTISYAEAAAPVTVDLGRVVQPADGDRVSSVESVVGSPFADSLTGNAVANRIVGGAGADTVAAGAGADRVEARDGEGDRVSCGADADTATSDRRTLDAVDGDCETVDALPEPVQPTGPEQPTDPQPTDPNRPTDPTTPDKELRFSLRGSSQQRLLRQRAVHVSVACPLEPCTTVASGSGPVKLRPVRTSVATGKARVVKLRLTRRQLASLRRQLAAGRSPRITVTVLARDSAGNSVRRKLRVTARR